MRRFKVVVLISIFLVSVAPAAAEKSNRLEELLIWKMSDELKLTSSEEKRFTDIVKKISERKAELNQALQKSIEKMMEEKKAPAQEAELKKYRQLTVQYAGLSQDEFDQLKTLLGSERMIKYLWLRQDLNNKIKTMLSQPDTGTRGKVVTPPQIIEEK